MNNFFHVLWQADIPAAKHFPPRLHQICRVCLRTEIYQPIDLLSAVGLSPHRGEKIRPVKEMGVSLIPQVRLIEDFKPINHRQNIHYDR
jgi:hypothetical protein